MNKYNFLRFFTKKLSYFLIINRKYVIFSKKIGSLLILSSLPLNSASAAFSVSTVNSIEGVAPVFDTSISMSDFKYFGITVNGKSYYDNDAFNDGLKLLELSARTNSPSDLGTIDFASFPIPDINDVIDPDGDLVNPASIKPKTDDSIIVKWYDKTTENELSNEQLNQSFCQLSYSGVSPYIKVSGPIILSTKYGAPAHQAYPNTLLNYPEPQKEFTISFEPVVCGAKPLSSTGKNGSIDQWDPVLGFLPQESGVNFPTTGATGLYFDLIVAGVPANSLEWTEEITSNNVKVKLSVSETKIRVLLDGPVASSSSAMTATADAFVGPASFMIEGKDETTGEVVIQYPFTIKKWFVDRKAAYSQSSNKTYCSKLTGYGLAGVRDLTNASVGPVAPDDYPPLSTTNVHSRTIGAGISGEWGDLTLYENVRFSVAYWTKDSNYSVGVNDGDVRSGSNADIVTFDAFCVSQ